MLNRCMIIFKYVFYPSPTAVHAAIGSVNDKAAIEGDGRTLHIK